MAEDDFDQLLLEIRDGFASLPDKPEETPESILKALWMMAAGEAKSAELAVHCELPKLSTPAQDHLQDLIGAWRTGTPLAHLTGRQNFCGMELLAGPDALIPRKETEILATAALDLIARCQTEHPVIIDVCTGCGNLALLYASRFPRALVYGADLSDAAVALATRNGEFTGLADRVEFRQGNLLEPFADGQFDQRVDVLSCNPPYISSKKVSLMPEEISGHEPAMAFDGGGFGISILQKLITEAVRYIRPGGYLVFELGLGQGPSIIKKMERNDRYSHVQGRDDEQGNVRTIVARIAP